MSAEILRGDCLDLLAEQSSDSFDAIVTDPPYGIGFMGKKWDRSAIELRPEAWASLLRVAKPGAHLIAFGSTRTFHRIWAAIEDAGWEIRDTLMWLYGTGFPKSSNQHGEWEGWGTALKPAFEPILLARKPLVGTVAHNLEQHRVGALNIEASRVATGDSTTRANHGGGHPENWRTGNAGDFVSGSELGRWPANVLHDGSEEVVAAFPKPHGAGSARDAIRSAEGAGLFGLAKGDGHRFGDCGSAARFFWCPKASRQDRNQGGVENHHPTVKPTELMRYLIRLVTPRGGLVLDPFAGSGSTGKAATLDGYRFVGMELDEQYAEIARRRIKFATGELA